MPNWFFEPLSKKPRQIADVAADDLDPTIGPEDKGFLKPFIAGALQGAGDVASDMTSPFSLATAAIPALGRAKGGIKAIDDAGMALMGRIMKPPVKAPPGIGMSGSPWGMMQQLPKAERMAEKAAPVAGKAMAAVGPSESEIAGRIINNLLKTEKSMDRTARINTAAKRSRRLQPGRFNEE